MRRIFNPTSDKEVRDYYKEKYIGGFSTHDPQLLEKFILPRLRITSSEITLLPATLVRQDSYSPQNSLSLSDNFIELDNLFMRYDLKRKPIKMMLIDDNNMLSQYITYKISHQTLWSNHFSCALNIDIQEILSSTKESLKNLKDKESLIAHFLKIEGLRKEDFKSILENKDKKPLFILENFDKFLPYLKDPEYERLWSFLSQQNVLLLGKNSSLDLINKFFRPHIIVKNEGYLYLDIKKTVHNFIENEVLQNKFLKFLNDNKLISTLAHHPKYLHIIMKKWQLEQGSVTSADILNHLSYSLLYPLEEVSTKLNFSENLLEIFKEIAFKGILNANTEIFQIKPSLYSNLEPNMAETYFYQENKYPLSKQEVLEIISKYTRTKADSEIVFSSLILSNFLSLPYTNNYQEHIGFTDPDLQLFLAGSYLTNLVLSKEKNLQEEAQSFISQHAYNPLYLEIIKFAANLVSLEKKEEAKIDGILSILNSAISSNVEMLKFTDNKQIQVLMHLIASIKNYEKIEQLESFIEKIDVKITSNIFKWKHVIISSGYLTSTVTNKLLEIISSGNKHGILTAMKTLRLSSYSDSHKNIISRLIVETENSDPLIVQKAIKVLREIDWSKKTLEAIYKKIDDEKLVISLIAIESLNRFPTKKTIDILKNKFIDSKDNMIQLACINSLKDIAHINSFKDSIFSFFFEQILNNNHLTFIIFKELANTLISMGESEKELITKFIDNFNSKTNEQELLYLLKKLDFFSDFSSEPSLDIIASSALDKYKSLRNPSMLIIFGPSTPRNFGAKSKIIYLMAKNFFYSSKKEEIYRFFLEKINHPNYDIYSSAIKGLASIYNYKDDEIFTSLNAFLDSTTVEDKKIITFQAIADIISKEQISMERIKSYCNKLLELVKNNQASKVSSAFLKVVEKTYTKFGQEEKSLLIDYIINSSEGKHSNDDIISLLADLFAEGSIDDRLKTYNYLFLTLTTTPVLKRKLLAMEKIKNLYQLLTTDQQQDFLKYLETLSHSPRSTLNELLKQANLILSSLTEQVILIEQNFDSIIASYAEENSIHSEKSLVDNYFSKLDSHHPYKPATAMSMLLTYLNTFSSTIHLVYGEIIKKMGVDSNFIKYVINSHDTCPYQIKLASKIIPLIDHSLLLSNSREVNNPFTNIDDIEENLDSFIEFIISNDLTLSITQKTLTVGEKIYTFNKTPDTINSIINKIVKALKNSPLKLVKHGYDTESFTEKYLGSLTTDQIRLSIITPILDKTNLMSKFILIEEKNHFGHSIYRKISFSDNSQISNYYSSQDKDHLTKIFGKSGEGVEYKFKSIIIDEQEKLEFLGSICDYHNSAQLTENVFLKLKHNWDRKLISYNTLTQYSSLEERVLKLEQNYQELENNLKAFGANQKLIEETISYISLANKPKSLIFDEYSENLYLTVRRSLNEIYLAAKVVHAQTGMVENVRKGMIGYLGSFFEFISPHVPLAGAGVDILGKILNAVDRASQEKLVERIANLAIDCNEMATLADEIATLVANRGLVEAKLKQNSISDFTKSVFNLAQDPQSFLIEAVISIELPSKVNDIKIKAREDARALVDILIAFFSSEKFTPSTDLNSNFLSIENFLNAGYLEPQKIFVNQPGELLKASSFDSPSKSIDNFSPTLGIKDVHSSDSFYIQTQLLRSSSNEEQSYDIRAIIPAVEIDYDFDFMENQSPREKLSFYTPIGNHEENQEKIPQISYLYPTASLNNAGIIGGIIMNGASVLNQAEYLFCQFCKWSKFCNSLELQNSTFNVKHYLSTAIHAAGNAVFSYNYNINPVTTFGSSLVFFSKPLFYAKRDELINSFGYELPEWLKASTYITSDAIISLVTNLPFMYASPYTVGYSLIQGGLNGAINYYHHNYNKDNIMGDITGVIATGATAIECYNFAQTQPNILSKIIIAEACIPAMATSHYFSKLTGNFIGNIIPQWEENDN